MHRLWLLFGVSTATRADGRRAPGQSFLFCVTLVVTLPLFKWAQIHEGESEPRWRQPLAMWAWAGAARLFPEKARLSFAHLF